MRFTVLVALLSALSIAGCSGGHQDHARAGDHGKGTVWEGQTRALDKAQHVNEMVQDGADRERRAIQKQSR